MGHNLPRTMGHNRNNILRDEVINGLISAGATCSAYLLKRTRIEHIIVLYKLRLHQS